MKTHDGSDEEASASGSDGGSSEDSDADAESGASSGTSKHAPAAAADPLARMTPSQLAEYEHRTEQLKAENAQKQTVLRTTLIRKFKRLQRRGRGDVPDLTPEALQTMELNKLELMVSDLSYSEEAEYWVDNIKRLVITLAFFLEIAVDAMAIDGLSIANYQRTLFLTIDKLEEPMYQLFEQYMFTTTQSMNPFWKLFMSLSLNLITFTIHKNFSKSHTKQLEDADRARREAAAAEFSPPSSPHHAPAAHYHDDDDARADPFNPGPAYDAPPYATAVSAAATSAAPPASSAAPDATPIFAESIEHAKQLDAAADDRTAPSSPRTAPTTPRISTSRYNPPPPPTFPSYNFN